MLRKRGGTMVSKFRESAKPLAVSRESRIRLTCTAMVGECICGWR